MAPVRWVREWVPQDVITPGGSCLLLKWVREDKLQSLRAKSRDEVVKEETKPEPNTETLFLCSYEGCRKAFTDHVQWRKHAQIHGERQYVCHFEGCGKKFLDSSKLKRHFLIHTGERNFVCPHEGCNKAFSLDFNLRAHMKTHSLENYHVCPYPDCGKRYTQENKLNSHIRSHHQKNGGGVELKIIKQTPPPAAKEKTKATVITTPKQTPAKEPKTVSPNRPFACHYEGCNKAYIHQYKLNLHLRKEHPDHDSPPQQQQQQQVGTVSSSSKKNKREMQQERMQETRPQKIVRLEESFDVAGTDFNAGADFDAGNQWGNNNNEEEDSEETEDDSDNDNDDDNDDDEETEDED